MARRTREEKEEWARKKTQIITVHQTNGDWRNLASELNVPQPTAYRWVNEGEKPETRGGKHNFKVLDEHREHMCNLIEDNPKITLQEIVSGIQTKFNVVLSKQTIARHLDALSYTLKDARQEPERANTPENKVKRKYFVENLLRLQSENLPMCFMDESNFNIHISRSEGRSRRGTRCSTVAAGSKGANIHVIGCISNLGLIYHEVRRGALKNQRRKSL